MASRLCQATIRPLGLANSLSLLLRSPPKGRCCDLVRCQGAPTGASTGASTEVLTASVARRQPLQLRATVLSVAQSGFGHHGSVGDARMAGSCSSGSSRSSSSRSGERVERVTVTRAQDRFDNWPASKRIGTSGKAVASLFDVEMQRCADAAAVVKAGAQSDLPFSMADLQVFFSRLKVLKKMPRSGGELHRFVEKVQDALPTCGLDGAHLAMTSFAELRCRQGAVAAWPLVMEHRDKLLPAHFADSIWAASSIPSPTKDIMYEAVGLAAQMAPQLAELPDSYLYRSIYGLARLSEGRGCGDFVRRAERAIPNVLRQPGPCTFNPSQLVKLCWAMARLGCREKKVFEIVEARLSDVVGELKNNELEALYGVLTDLQLVGQWKLIHDIERALEARQEQQGDPNKAPRRRPFRRRWTRASLMNPVAQSTRKPAQRR
ncbi:unnamed protein product [Polarella glacialis]|uniref:Uncharacterized protein n=1 Tax=Polarella glacialis TaxID=89957 RepID=A0A813FJ82_POLGL|nr:unnamed protein product [Polarella glacialis]CAE8612833.1 unnamed protein product [Polarella glacialis]